MHTGYPKWNVKGSTREPGNIVFPTKLEKANSKRPQIAHKLQRRDAHLWNGVPNNATYLCFYIRLLSPSSLGNFCWCRCHRIRKSLICWLGCEVYNGKANKGEETFWRFDPEIKEHDITLYTSRSPGRARVSVSLFLGKERGAGQRISIRRMLRLKSYGCHTQWLNGKGRHSVTVLPTGTHLSRLHTFPWHHWSLRVLTIWLMWSEVETGPSVQITWRARAFLGGFIHKELQGALRKTSVLSIYLWVSEISISHFRPLCILF